MGNFFITNWLRGDSFIVRYLLGIFIIVGGIVLLPSSLVGYETNMDFIINLLFKKVNQNTFHSPQMFIFYDFILLKLYGAYESINWYLLLKFALTWLAYTAFFFAISKSISLIWYGIYVVIFFLYVSVFQHHVHVAYLLCICGIFLNYNSIGLANSPKRNLLLILSVLTYFSGFFIRWEVGALTIVLYSIVLLLNFNREKILGSLLLVIPAYLLVAGINLYFAKSDKFQHRIEPDGEFLFLSGIGYQPEQMSSLEDSIRYDMLSRFIVDDTVLLSYSDMTLALDAARKSHVSFLGFSQIYKSAKNAVQDYVHFTIMIFLCFILLVLRMRWKGGILFFLFLGTLFIRTEQIEERHFIGLFLFIFLLTFSTDFSPKFILRSVALLIFLVSVIYMYEKLQVQKEIAYEKEIVLKRIEDVIKPDKRLYLPISYKDFSPSKLVIGSDILGDFTDNIVLLSLHQESHSDFFIDYLSRYCNKDLLNIGNVYSCVAEDKDNVLIVAEDFVPILNKIINRYYKLNIQFVHLGVLCGEADYGYNFKHLKETIHLYHLESK